MKCARVRSNTARSRRAVNQATSKGGSLQRASGHTAQVSVEAAGQQDIAPHSFAASPVAADPRKGKIGDLSPGIIPSVHPLEQMIVSSRGSGATLPAHTNAFMRNRIGADFSQVKIHTDQQAAIASSALNAHAFTIGNDIYFNEGRYHPGTPAGRQLLAHELTHVLQQGKGPNHIRRAQIGHRQLKWTDFKAAPPKDAAYDAETYSGINVNGLGAITASKTVEATKADCETIVKGKTKSDKNYKVKVGVTPFKPKANAYMDQAKSWVKKLYSSEQEMKATCLKDEKDNINACKTDLVEQVSSRDEDCKNELVSCEAVTKEGKTFSRNFGSTSFVANKKAECSKVTGVCKKFKDASIKHTTGNNDEVATQSNCEPVIVKPCVDARKTSSAELLQHEQGHFDVSQVMAQQLTATMQAIADGFSYPDEEVCSKAAADKHASELVKDTVNPAITTMRSDIQTAIDDVLGVVNEETKFREGGTQSDEQARYDEETDHSAKEAMQKRWNTSLAKNKIPEKPQPTD